MTSKSFQLNFTSKAEKPEKPEASFHLRVPTPDSRSCFSLSSPVDRRFRLEPFDGSASPDCHLFASFKLAVPEGREPLLDSPDRHRPSWTLADADAKLWALCRENSDLFPHLLDSPAPLIRVEEVRHPTEERLFDLTEVAFPVPDSDSHSQLPPLTIPRTKANRARKARPNPHEQIGRSLTLELLELDDKPAIADDKDPEDSEDLSSRPPAIKITKKEKESGCSCKRTRCLRLHCRCFNELGYCGPDCGCFNCGNRPQFEAERQFVIEKTRRIFPQAFESKIQRIDAQTTLNNQGCRCKTGCRKNYCDCFKNGADCSPICRCATCRNNKLVVERAEIRRFYCPPFRSKDKIVISAGSPAEPAKRDHAQFSCDRDSRETVAEPEPRGLSVGFQAYKRKKTASRARTF